MPITFLKRKFSSLFKDDEKEKQYKRNFDEATKRNRILGSKLDAMKSEMKRQRTKEKQMNEKRDLEEATQRSLMTQKIEELEKTIEKQSKTISNLRKEKRILKKEHKKLKIMYSDVFLK